MTAVRWLARGAACLVLLLAMVTAVFWTWMGPQGSWTLAWLAAMFVTITGAVWGLVALQPQWVPAPCPCNCWCSCPAPCQRDDDDTPGWCDPCRMNIHQEA